MSVHLDNSDKADIRRMHGEGCKNKEIAEYIGCSRSTVERLLRRERGGYPLVEVHPWSEDEEKALQEYWNSGKTLESISEDMHRKIRSIIQRVYLLRRNGWEMYKRPYGCVTTSVGKGILAY